MLEKSVPEAPIKRTYAGVTLQELQSVERTYTGAVHEGTYPMGETPCWSRRKMSGGRNDKDKVVWTDCNPYSPCQQLSSQGEEIEGSGMKERS